MLRTTSLINKTITKRLALNCFSSVTENKINLIKQYVDDIDAFDNIKGDIKYDKESSQLLKDLSESTKIPLLHGVNAIMLGNNGVLPFDDSYCANTIFERSFYNDLLKCLYEDRCNILIGNPGTSKSMFQYYYLARLLNPDIFDPLPIKSNGSQSIPNVIIIQKGVSRMTINLIKEKESFNIKGIDDRLLELFDESTAEYWFEPDSSKTEPFYDGIELPILITVSPNIDRYKEFSKNGAVMSYMPVYELEELLAIGQYMIKNSKGNNLNDFQKYILSDESIIKKYEEYDGIIRHVFPYVKKQEEEIILLKNQALKEFNYKSFKVTMNIENSNISHLLAKYVVNKSDFSKVTYQFVNNNTVMRMALENKTMEIDDYVDLLIFIDNKPQSRYASSYYSWYQRLIALLLTSTSYDVNWKKRVYKKGDKTDLDSYKNISITKKMVLKPVIDIPHFDDMESDCLYYPSSGTFPFCDMFYKEDNKIVAIQVTGGLSKKNRNITGLNKFMKIVKLTEADKSRIKYVLIPHPKLADNYKITDTFGLEDLEIWKIPIKYLE